jgi:phenylpyruvate tautomerase PptA (4-oxalocrotonate tautomerase family)
VPIIELKAFPHRFEREEACAELVTRLTEVIREMFGDEAAQETWVIPEGVSRKHWGFGGALRT